MTFTEGTPQVDYKTMKVTARMKKLMIIATLLVLSALAWVFVPLMLLPVNSLADKDLELTITVRDWQGKEHPFLIGPKNRHWTPINRIPKEMVWSVIIAEDANFYEHGGMDVDAIKEAFKYNLEQRRMARGASTITQQLAKNLFLSREKTITRKLKEIYLTKRLEQTLSKDRIMELYLNVVELGPMVHGVGHGSRYYFGKSPAALTPRESAFLASMLPGPRIAYNPYRNLRKVLNRSNMILKRMRSAGIINHRQLEQALASSLNIAGLQQKVDKVLEQPAVEVESPFESDQEQQETSNDEFVPDGAAGTLPENEDNGPVMEESTQDEIPGNEQADID